MTLDENNLSDDDADDAKGESNVVTVTDKCRLGNVAHIFLYNTSEQPRTVSDAASCAPVLTMPQQHFSDVCLLRVD